MKKLLIKLLTVVLCMATFFTALAGCGSTSNQDEKTSISSTGTNTQQTETKEKAPERIKLTFYALNWSPKDMPDNDLVKAEIEKRIAETINIELNVVEIPGSEYWNKLNVAIASGEQIDAFSEGMNNASNWGGKGDFVQDIGPLVDKYGSNIKKFVDPIAWKMITFNGKTIGLPNHDKAPDAGIIVRKDILDKYNIPMPTTLGELEKAFAALKAADPKILPSMGQWWMMECVVAPALGKQYSGSYVIDDAKQEITQGYFTEETLPFLQTFKKWKDNGWYDKDHLINQNKPEVDINAFAAGKTAFVFNGLFLIKPYSVAAQKIDPNADIAFIPSLGPNNTDWSFSGPTSMCVIVPKMCKDPARVVQYYDWMLSDQSNYDLVVNGLEGKQFKYVDQNGTKMMQMLQSDDQKTYSGLFADGLAFDNGGLDIYAEDPNDPNVRKNNDLYNSAKSMLKNTKWVTDPLIGKVTLDKSIETKYPLLASLVNDWFVSKLLTGQVPPTSEGIEQMLNAYKKAGGEEVSKEYYKQYKASGN